MGAPESAFNRSSLSVNWQIPVNHNHPLNKGLRAWYLCQPSFMGGTVLQDLVARKNGDLINMDGSNWGFNSRLGGWGSISTNGTNEHVHLNHAPVADNAVDDNFSFCGWIRTANTAAGQYCLTESNTGSDQPIFALINQSGEPRMFLRDMEGGASATLTGVNIADGAWHFWQLSSKGGTAYLWVDGQHEATLAYSSGAALGLNAASIGALHRTSVGSYAQVEVDDVRFYSRGLTFLEHQELYRLSQQGYGGLLNRITHSRYSEAVVASGFQPAWAMNVNTLYGGGLNV